MNFQEIDTWLKTTIPGIVLLGAAGSVVAVWLCKLLGPVCIRALGWPFAAYRNKRTFQAYTLGFSHSLIQQDKTGRLLVTFLVYHIAKLIVIVTLGLAG